MEDKVGMVTELICLLNSLRIVRVSFLAGAIVLGLWLSVFSACATEPRIVGNFPSKEQIAMMDIDAVKGAINDYIIEVGSAPPLDNRRLFRALDGHNPRKMNFLSTEYMARDHGGKVVDPWGKPYLIKSDGNSIVISSSNSKYTAKVMTHVSGGSR